MKQNSAYALLMKGFFCIEHTESVGIALSSTGFLDVKLATFSEVWVHALFHCFVCLLFVCQVHLTSSPVVVKKCNS